MILWVYQRHKILNQLKAFRIIILYNTYSSSVRKCNNLTIAYSIGLYNLFLWRSNSNCSIVLDKLDLCELILELLKCKRTNTTVGSDVLRTQLPIRARSSSGMQTILNCPSPAPREGIISYHVNICLYKHVLWYKVLCALGEAQRTYV